MWWSGYRDCDPDFFYPDEKGMNAVVAWASQAFSRRNSFKNHLYEEGVIFDDGVIKVTAIQNKHTDRAFSFYVEAEGKKVFFSGDLKIQESDAGEKPDLPAEEFDKGLDLAILELAHFNAVDKYYKFLKDRTNINTVCINHYSSFKIASYYSLCELLPKQKFVLATDRLEFEL
jgi:hypothetical protein